MFPRIAEILAPLITVVVLFIPTEYSVLT